MCQTGLLEHLFSKKKKKSSWKNIFKRNPQQEALGYDEICGYELE